MSNTKELILERMNTLGNVRGFEKRKIKKLGQEEALKMLEECKGDDEKLLGEYAVYLRLKEFLGSFEKEMKPKLIEAAENLKLEIRKKIGDTEFMLIEKNALDYKACGSNVYSTLLEEKEELEKDIKALEKKFKNIDKEATINGEELNPPACNKSKVLNAFY